MQVTDDIHKPERDERLYRRVTFPNGLEALLISDPSLVRSSESAPVAGGGGARSRLSRSRPPPYP
jgi:secreted Zn-dependent insulinase-like peptidase